MAFSGGVDKAVVLCFFDEAHGVQGSGAYENYPYEEDVDANNFYQGGTTPKGVYNNTIVGNNINVDTTQYGHPDWGDVYNGTAIQIKPGWTQHYNSWTTGPNGFNSYSFIKCFLYPVIPGCHAGGNYPNSICGVSCAQAAGDSPHVLKQGASLHALARIHTGAAGNGKWTAADGPLPVNPVIQAAGGNFGALEIQNPYYEDGKGGLDQYGWSIDVTPGTANTTSIAQNFTSGAFSTALNNLLFTTSNCPGTDCVNISVINADTNNVLLNSPITIDGNSYTTGNTGTLTLSGIVGAVHTIQDCFTLTTSGSCSTYDLTIAKKTFSFTSGCIDPNACTYDPAASYNCSGDCNYVDCYGECGGTAYLDDCDQCVGGSTGLDPNYAQDLCGECFGDNSSCTACLDPISLNYLHNCQGDYVPDATIDDGCCQPINSDCIIATLTRKIIDNCNASVTNPGTCLTTDKDNWYKDRLLRISTFHTVLNYLKTSQEECEYEYNDLSKIITMLGTLSANMECRNCNNC